MQTMLSSPELSKNQIDRLGGRLRKGDINETDLRLLDSYRRSFSDATKLLLDGFEMNFVWSRRADQPNLRRQ